jgi:hypothetical protein
VRQELEKQLLELKKKQPGMEPNEAT